ncbi:glutathione S-transferase [Trematosphaeria pertusa]|uniref:Glutathione S-transferase n=1 Tax=Trematosphaeria pertusa TaxID=390896 RepID=A0A6A6IQY3_9PLEO|nr:glutathione S-transferase [Trematosphaeria pertusa]KAF2252954.1 glutathione S-transferase [Trematosphaeria pertusa]
MAPFGILYTTNTFLHARVTKILAAAHLNNLNITIAPEFEYGVTNQTPEYKAKFPHGKIPALETPSGFYLAEAAAIAYYVSESGPFKDQLTGRTAEDRALVQMWMSFADLEVFLNATGILGPIMGVQKYIPETVEEKEKQFVRALKRLEYHLAQEGKVWLVRDDEFSLADLSVAASLYWPLRFFMDDEYRKEYPKTMGWWESLMGVEAVGKAFGAPVKLCEQRPPAEGSKPPAMKDQ